MSYELKAKKRKKKGDNLLLSGLEFLVSFALPYCEQLAALPGRKAVGELMLLQDCF